MKWILFEPPHYLQACTKNLSNMEGVVYKPTYSWPKFMLSQRITLMGTNDWYSQQLQTCNLGTSFRETVITCLQYLKHSLYICRLWKRRVMEFLSKRFHSRIRLFAAASNIRHYDSKWLPPEFCYQASQFLLRRYWWWYRFFLAQSGDNLNSCIRDCEGDTH